MHDDVVSPLKNWVPYQLAGGPGEETCRWLFLGDKAFTEPFFDDTISNRRGLPFNTKKQRVVSGLEVLPEWSALIDKINPTAIIFHVSRCGSTLLSQMLGLDPANIVLSEVPFIDQLLRHGKKYEQDVSSFVSSAIGFYGAKRDPKNKNLFIKADSWHIHFYRELRALYPGIPFILLYRRPDEVLRSQQKKRGMHAVQGVVEPNVFGFNAEAIMEKGLDEYLALVLETYFSAFLDIIQTDERVLLLNYNEGAIPMMEKIIALTGIEVSEEQIAAMHERAGFHAKYPGEVFSEKAMEEPVPPFLQKAQELYEAVERIRQGSGK